MSTVLPLRAGGALQGLTACGMCMNDAHIYVTPEQLKDEFKAVMDLHKTYYDLFGFEDYYLRLSQWDPDDPKKGDKYVDDPEGWAFTEKVVQEASEELGLSTPWSARGGVLRPEGGLRFRTVTSANLPRRPTELDFAVPKRFGLVYTDSDGEEKTPYCIHRPLAARAVPRS